MRNHRTSFAISFLAALALVVGACSSPAEPTGSPDRFSADVGCDARMDQAFLAWATRGVAASIVDIGGDRECVGAYGLADPDTGRPNTTHTVFSIGSITKALTAAAIFDLIDDGVLALDDTAGQHVVGLSGGVAESSIRDLLLHTSGITGEHGVDHSPLSDLQAIESISGLGIAFDPGSRYQYANANYTLLALVIESLTELGYRQYLADEIMLDRTGRQLGGFWDGEPAPPGPRALGHFSGGRVSQQQGQAPGPHWAMDGNGLVAMTPLDLAEWTYALFTNRILSPEATEALLATSTLLPGEKEVPGWGGTGPDRVR